jgi:toxin YoeB
MEFWVENDRSIARRLFRIIRETLRDPFGGIGKPEHLKHLGPDVWSKRLTEADRIVYVVYDDRIDFLHGRYHYGDA